MYIYVLKLSDGGNVSDVIMIHEEFATPCLEFMLENPVGSPGHYYVLETWLDGKRREMEIFG